jgi:hypothetical protein
MLKTGGEQIVWVGTVHFTTFNIHCGAGGQSVAMGYSFTLRRVILPAIIMNILAYGYLFMFVLPFSMAVFKDVAPFSVKFCKFKI